MSERDPRLDDYLICYNWMPLVADHVIDFPQEFYTKWGVQSLHEKKLFQPDDEVNEGDVVFVKTDFIVNGEFQEKWLPSIDKPFKLVTGISSYQIDREDSGYEKILENEYLQRWYCTNPPMKRHDKIQGVPIGFAEPNRLSSNQNVLKRLRRDRKQFEEKANMFFIPWHDQTTNSKRTEIINQVKKNEFVHMMASTMSMEPYNKLIDCYRYTICVQGSGNDTHRLYESLLMGCVPITIDCSIKHIFEDHGIPGYFIESWDDITEDFYKEVSNTEHDFSNVEKFLQVSTHADMMLNDVI